MCNAGILLCLTPPHYILKGLFTGTMAGGRGWAAKPAPGACIPCIAAPSLPLRAGLLMPLR